MNGKRKWLVVVPETMYLWIKDNAKKNAIKGSDIVVNAVEKVMDDKDFLASLAETKLKVQLEKLNDEEAAIVERREALKRQFKETTGRERVKV